MIKILISYIIAKITKKYSNYWIISERGTDARDNGYFFYKYLKEEKKVNNIKYIISSDSEDRKKIKNKEDIIKYNSIKHGIAYFSAKYCISSHPTFCKPNWKGIYKLEKKNIVKKRGKDIFLQHGVIKDKLNDLTAKSINPILFICGAEPEYEYIEKEFGFEKGIVQYTGLARFDNLYKLSNVYNEQIILLMPTWRKENAKCSDEEFVKTEYYKKYQELIVNKELNEFIDKNGYKIIFYPHYEVQKKIHLFNTINENIIIADFNHYDVQDLLLKCKLLVTDYSSVFFDIAYQKKPVVFYHFDYEDYREKHYSEGYFDYNDSFGPVCKNSNELIESIKQIIFNGLDDKYKKNQNRYFKYYDENNCKRIYDMIMEKEKNEKK